MASNTVITFLIWLWSKDVEKAEKKKIISLYFPRLLTYRHSRTFIPKFKYFHFFLYKLNLRYHHVFVYVSRRWRLQENESGKKGRKKRIKKDEEAKIKCFLVKLAKIEDSTAHTRLWINIQKIQERTFIHFKKRANLFECILISKRRNGRPFSCFSVWSLLTKNQNSLSEEVFSDWRHLFR